jgi:hypothetical protein
MEVTPDGDVKGTAGRMTVNKGALAILVHGGTENWSPQRWKAGSTGVCEGRSVLLVPDASFDPAEVHYAAVWKPRPGELAAFPNLRVIFNLGRRCRCADGGPLIARRAAGARGRHRPHRADDGICRAACADAPPAGALLAGIPARQTLGAEIAMGGGRDLGRNHGAGRARG